ncbi:unnamed protein product, partial [Prorocentrum cordatum]
ALDTSQHWGFLAGMQPRRDLYQLEQELRKGKCDIVISEEGRVLRVVSLCLARLTRADGRVLAELGDMKDGRLSMGCKLPGTKVRSQELPHDALRRFIRKQFAHLEPEKLVELEESLISQATREVNSEEKVSQNYGINSRAMAGLRNEFRMQIESELFSQDGSRALARSSSRTSGRFGFRRIQGESAESLQVAQYEAFAKIDPEEPDKVTVMDRPRGARLSQLQRRGCQGEGLGVQPPARARGTLRGHSCEQQRRQHGPTRLLNRPAALAETPAHDGGVRLRPASRFPRGVFLHGLLVNPPSF